MSTPKVASLRTPRSIQGLLRYADNTLRLSLILYFIKSRLLICLIMTGLFYAKPDQKKNDPRVNWNLWGLSPTFSFSGQAKLKVNGAIGVIQMADNPVE